MPIDGVAFVGPRNTVSVRLRLAKNYGKCGAAAKLSRGEQSLGIWRWGWKMWDEIVKSVKANLYERATSPLLGTYTVAWGLWNFRFLLVLFSDAPYEQKLDYIQANFFPNYWSSLHLFWPPLIATLLFIFVYPYPSRYVYQFWRMQQKIMKEIRQKIEDETPLTQEEARQLRSELRNLELARDNEINSRNLMIQSLREQLQRYEKAEANNSEPTGRSNSPPKTPAEKVYPFSPDDKQLDLLKKIASAPVGLSELTLTVGPGDERLLAEFNLGELRSHGLIEKWNDERGQSVVSLTQEGRRVLVKPPLKETRRTPVRT